MSTARRRAHGRSTGAAAIGSEIARGLDLFELLPSAYLSQNEIDAAKLPHFDTFNPQMQPKIVWPAAFPVVRSYLDQLVREFGRWPRRFGVSRTRRRDDVACRMPNGRRAAWIIAMFAGLCGPAQAVVAQSSSVVVPDSAAVVPDSTPPYTPVSLHEYAGRVAGPRAIGRIVLVSGFDQAMGRPRERDRTWRGFEDRLATRAAQQTIAATVVLGLSATFGERPAHFTLCSCTERGPRLVHALAIPWRVETPHGTVWSGLVAVTELTSALLVTTLEPRGFSWGEGLRAGATGLLASSVLYAAREFWPWHRRPPGF